MGTPLRLPIVAMLTACACGRGRDKPRADGVVVSVSANTPPPPAPLRAILIHDASATTGALTYPRFVEGPAAVVAALDGGIERAILDEREEMRLEVEKFVATGQPAQLFVFTVDCRLPTIDIDFVSVECRRTRRNGIEAEVSGPQTFDFFLQGGTAVKRSLEDLFVDPARGRSFLTSQCDAQLVVVPGSPDRSEIPHDIEAFVLTADALVFPLEVANLSPPPTTLSFRCAVPYHALAALVRPATPLSRLAGAP